VTGSHGRLRSRISQTATNVYNGTGEELSPGIGEYSELAQMKCRRPQGAQRAGEIVSSTAYLMRVEPDTSNTFTERNI